MLNLLFLRNKLLRVQGLQRRDKHRVHAMHHMSIGKLPHGALLHLSGCDLRDLRTRLDIHKCSGHDPVHPLLQLPGRQDKDSKLHTHPRHHLHRLLWRNILHHNGRDGLPVVHQGAILTSKRSALRKLFRDSKSMGVLVFKWWHLVDWLYKEHVHKQRGRILLGDNMCVQ